MHVFYLHGFASSPSSAKAAYFADRFHAHGLTLRRPDFNEPDFASLTMTRMLDQVAADIATLDLHGGPVVLIGSSLGAVVAIHTAARIADRVHRLVLLAPAVMFPKDAAKVLGVERVRAWQRDGTLDVFHHFDQATRQLAYAFYADGLQYDAFDAKATQPTLAFQGLRDEAVDHRMVELYAATRPNVQLTLLDDDHQLHASLPVILKTMAPFLELT